MTCRIRLALAIHNHQPVGNFDHVFEDACRDSYEPFLDVLEAFPEIPISLHISGSLLEWLEAARPEYVDRVRGLAERGQIELLGGAFYEPILAGIPRRDRVGQIAAYSSHLERLFGQPVRGMWIPERVWEQSFAGDIARAGIEYTILDDFHFRSAGLRDDQLHSYYVTEEEGRLLKVFPVSERLRYTIPFADPAETIEYLRGIADRFPNALATFGDDGEKFGTWPGTRKHVYEDGWLRRFFATLRDNADWLNVVTLSESVDHLPPAGRCFLPDSSYREMTEWALPTDRQIEYAELKTRHERDFDWNELKLFMRGGYWRNFRAKYSEANEMYCRMLLVSRRLEELLQADGARRHADLLNRARTELYRGQCNCSYWHGAFGGLYLPHLRNAVYRNLIAADNLLETVAASLSGSDSTNGASVPRAGGGRWARIDADDYNLDARKEVRIAGDRLVAWLAPARGGHLYELDVRATRHNLLATLNRRPEPYHERIRQIAQAQDSPEPHRIASIHELVHFKQPDLDKKIVYDRWPRKSLVDHFLEPGLALERFQRGEGELGDFVAGVYEARLRRGDGWVEAWMARDGQVGPHRVRVIKTVGLAADAGGTLEVRYVLENLPPNQPFCFGVEFNFAGLAAGALDRYYYDAEGRQLGQLGTVQDLSGADRIGLVDEWRGLDVAVESSRPGSVWAFPVETISQSEGGFELVHQSCAVVPHWTILPPADGRWEVTLRLSVDTSVAQARELREPAVSEH